MKFKGQGNTIVWDKERNRKLCQFTKGEFESEDPRTCEILVELGYEHEGELPKVEEPKTEDPKPPIDEELEELRVKAAEYGIEFKENTKKDTLQKKVAAHLEKLGKALDKAAELGIEGYEDLGLEDLLKAIAEKEGA